jgi:steroid delta-isomerase-like uncharacterized protein
MSAEQNKAIARRWGDEVWAKGDLAAVDELFAADFVCGGIPPGMAPDREGHKQLVTMWRAAFPEAQWVTEDMIAEGDKVVVRWSGRGVHKGQYMGIEPTGKVVTMTGISILRIANEKIADMWTETNTLAVMQQLGVFTPAW